MVIIMFIREGSKKIIFLKNDLRMKKVTAQYIGEYVLDFSFFLV